MKRNDRFVVAIDGPAASGKSTVAAAVADRLDGLMFDTGAVYRALALLAIEQSVSPDDGERLGELARALDVDVRSPSHADGRQYDVMLNGRDVTWEIRDPRVDQTVSAVSAHPSVRRNLLQRQREIGRSGRVVMPGRDIGTVVIPDADIKIWLDASLDERVNRRVSELRRRGVDVRPDDVRADMTFRDSFDSGRAESPMMPASDAILINTDALDIEDVIERVIDCVEKVLAVELCERDGNE